MYITCDPQPHIALWLSTLVFYCLPKLAYDRDFGEHSPLCVYVFFSLFPASIGGFSNCFAFHRLCICLFVCTSAVSLRMVVVHWSVGCLSADTLVRRKTSHQMDGAPFILGIATILKQLHPTVTQQVLSV